MATKLEKKIIASETFRFGSVDILAPEDAKRSVLDIRFNSISTSKGNPVSMSVAAFQPDAEAVCDAAPDKVFRSLKRACAGKLGTLFVGVDPRPAYTETKLETSENGLESETVINHPAESQTEMIQAEMALVVAFCERHKPVTASGPKLRDIPTELQKYAADMFLIAAGVSGKIPTLAEIQAMLTDAMLTLARKDAETKAAKLLTDTLGQYRTRKEKGADAKAEATPVTTTEATPVPESDEVPEVEILAQDDTDLDGIEDDSEVEETA